MLAVIALFDTKDAKDTFHISSSAFTQISAAFAGLKESLSAVKTVIAYYAGRDGAQKPALALPLESCIWGKNDLTLKLGTAKTLGIKSAAVSSEVYHMASQHGWLGEKGHAPLLVLMPRDRMAQLCQSATKDEQMQALMAQKDYKGVCMLFAPLRDIKKDEQTWNSADRLYNLGLACSKLATTLLIKASEVKKLEEARRYRDFCVAFLMRGAELETDNARCATALAYRYYSNVHELMRPGERRDQELGAEIENANEWLSRALEIYPQSVRNNYRKGKLIIEKQAPYLLFGKRSFGAREAELLREIREVGEEHLATAISLYDALHDDEERQKNKREYAKALFVLGGYYLDDAYLPLHEYYLRVAADVKGTCPIQSISKLDLQTSAELLEKCFYAETDMPLVKLDIPLLSNMQKEWTRSPAEKLYRLGCAYSGMAFLARAANEDVHVHAHKAITFLEAAKRVTEGYKDRKHNTWHISEKIAWTYLHMGQYERAAKLLARARAGYIVNTFALALMLSGTEEAWDKAKEALAAAAKDKHNLAAGLSGLLYKLACKKAGQTDNEPLKNLSVRNARLASVLGLEMIVNKR